MKIFPLLVGVMALLTVGCATKPLEPPYRPAAPERSAVQTVRPTMSPITVAPAPTRAKPPKPTAATRAPSMDDIGANSPTPAGDTPPERKASPEEELAVLRVEAGALITQVNGDPKLRCIRPDCSIPLPPGTHRFAVLYRDTATRQGSTVTYASMYPRVIEVTLEPGHHYAVSAAGRYSRNWWVAVEDQTSKTIVYNDRKSTE